MGILKIKKLLLVLLFVCLTVSCSKDEEKKFSYFALYILNDCDSGVSSRKTYCVTQETQDRFNFPVGTRCEDRYIQFIDRGGYSRAGYYYGKSDTSQSACREYNN